MLFDQNHDECQINYRPVQEEKLFYISHAEMEPKVW